MTRRWLFWVGGFVLVAAGALAMLAFFVPARSDAPFDFLARHKPVAAHFDGATIHGWRNGFIRYYLFKTEYDAFTREARKELLARGYDEPTKYPDAAFFRHKSTTVRAGKGWVGEQPTLTIQKGVHIPRPDGMTGKIDESKWVTVVMLGTHPPRPPTLLERVRDWIGL